MPKRMVEKVKPEIKKTSLSTRSLPILNDVKAWKTVHKDIVYFIL